MSTAEWTVYHAARSIYEGDTPAGRFEIKSALATDWGDSPGPREVARFRYVLTFKRELVPDEERRRRVLAGEPFPSLVRVAVRRTWAEVDGLARKWEREAR